MTAESQSHFDSWLPVPSPAVLIAAIALLFTCTAFTIARFSALQAVPRGFYTDEAAAVLNAICIRTRGTDSLLGARLPMFFIAETTGIHGPTSTYGFALWSFVFGDSPAAYRSFSAAVTVMTGFGVYALANALFGRTSAILALICATLSPWGFQFSRIAWDAPLYPCFLIWGSVLLVTGRTRLKGISCGFLLALAAVTYAPARASVPVILATLMALRLYERSAAPVFILPCIISFIGWSVSLLVGLMGGQLMGRTASLSIMRFLPEIGIWGVIKMYISNLLLHLSPSFLLLQGDVKNGRHGTMHAGVLSPAEALGVLVFAGLAIHGAIISLRSLRSGDGGAGEMSSSPDGTASRRNSAPRHLVVVIALVATLSGAALTTDSLPHALRAIGAWPWFAVAAGQGLGFLASRWPRAAWTATASTSLAFCVYFLTIYFAVYPNLSGSWFDAQLGEKAKQVARHELSMSEIKYRAAGEQLVVRYYQITLGDKSCQRTMPPYKNIGSAFRWKWPLYSNSVLFQLLFGLESMLIACALPIERETKAGGAAERHG